MEIMEWWWRFGDGNGVGGSEMEMGFFLHVRFGRFAAEAAA
jgi:hypothetical protein